MSILQSPLHAAVWRTKEHTARRQGELISTRITSIRENFRWLPTGKRRDVSAEMHYRPSPGSDVPGAG